MAKDKVAVPLDFVDFDGDTMTGFEQITSSTMAIPFLRVTQMLTPVVNKTKPEYIEGAEPGMFFNTVTNALYGKEIRAIALTFEHFYIEWEPDRGGFVDRHSPEHAEEIAADKSQFGKWKTANGNELQENYAYLVVLEDHTDEGMLVLPLASSNIKAAKEWNRLMTTHVLPNGQLAKPYYLTWKLSLESRENNKGAWFAVNIKFDGYVSKVAYEKTQAERKQIPDRTIDYARISDSEAGEGQIKLPY